MSDLKKIVENNNDTKCLGLHFMNCNSEFIDDYGFYNVEIGYNSLDFDRAGDFGNIELAADLCGNHIDILKLINMLMLIHLRCNRHGYNCTISLHSEGYLIITICKEITEYYLNP